MSVAFVVLGALVAALVVYAVVLELRLYKAFDGVADDARWLQRQIDGIEEELDDQDAQHATPPIATVFYAPGPGLGELTCRKPGEIVSHAGYPQFLGEGGGAGYSGTAVMGIPAGCSWIGAAARYGEVPPNYGQGGGSGGGVARAASDDFTFYSAADVAAINEGKKA